MKIKTSTTKLNPLHADFDTTLSGLASSIVNGLGVLPVVSGGSTEYEVPNEMIDLATADMLHLKGVEIKNFPLWIEINSIEDDNAFGVEGADEEGVSTGVLSWSEWKLSNHTFHEADGRIFIGTNAHTNEYMDFADLQGVRASLVTSEDLPVNNAGVE